MEKSDKKRILTRVLIVIAALTLLSCCFLGSTFAKYVTSANGSGTVGVALWKIKITGGGTGTSPVSFSDLSPDIDVGGANSTNTTGYVKIAEIRNEGEVDASITFSASEQPKITWVDSQAPDDSTEGYTTYYSEDNTKAMFSIAFYSDDKGTALSSETTLAPKATLTIYARVTWTTIDDDTDTWYGEHVDTVSWALSYTATQNSERPNPPAP